MILEAQNAQVSILQWFLQKNDGARHSWGRGSTEPSPEPPESLICHWSSLIFLRMCSFSLIFQTKNAEPKEKHCFSLRKSLFIFFWNVFLFLLFSAKYVKHSSKTLCFWTCHFSNGRECNNFGASNCSSINFATVFAKKWRRPAFLRVWQRRA